MLLEKLKSKIHRARVTEADLNYVGSITIDTQLMEAAHIKEHEKVSIVNINNGARFETYVIKGGPGVICLNGAAARLCEKDDLVIIMSFCYLDEAAFDNYQPKLVFVDEHNSISNFNQ